MISSLALVFLVGLALASIFQKLNLPRLIGFLLTGILLGPYVLDWLDPSTLAISAELRQIALIIILIKAGLSLDLADLKAVGRPAIFMAFLPASFEILAYILFAPKLFAMTLAEAAVLGSVLAAVSPAVVVPKMVQLMDQGYGTDKKIPQLILAGASADDIFVIVLFTSFLGIVQGGEARFLDLLNIPISIVAGIILGIVAGFILHHLFESAHAKNNHIRNSVKVIIILGTAFLLMSFETWLQAWLPISGPLAIVSMALTLGVKSIDFVTSRLSEKFGKLWLAAEILLFVLVGAAVDIRFALKAGPLALLILVIGLIFRSVGVLLSLIGTNLTWRERVFCVLAYLPKATVQAAIGSVPLALGLGIGQTVLSIAVLAILITAPLGSIAIEFASRKWLAREEKLAKDLPSL